MLSNYYLIIPQKKLLSNKFPALKYLCNIKRVLSIFEISCSFFFCFCSVTPFETKVPFNFWKKFHFSFLKIYVRFILPTKGWKTYVVNSCDREKMEGKLYIIKSCKRKWWGKYWTCILLCLLFEVKMKTGNMRFLVQWVHC